MDDHDNEHTQLASRRNALLDTQWFALSAAVVIVLGRAGAWISHALALPNPAFCYLTQVGAVMFLGRTWTAQQRWQPGRSLLALARAAAGRMARYPLIHELLRYVVVGVSTTLLDFALLNLALLAFPALPPLGLGLASGSSYALSLIVAYHWHRRWTFRAAGRTQALAWRFVALNISTIVINALATVLLTAALPLVLPLGAVAVVNLSKAGATMLSGGLNFTGNRVWVFQSTARPLRMRRAEKR